MRKISEANNLRSYPARFGGYGWYLTESRTYSQMLEVILFSAGNMRVDHE